MGRPGAGHHGGCCHSAGSCAGAFAECAAGPGLRRCSPSSERSRGAFSCTEKIELGILIEEVSPRSTNIQSERVAFYLTLSARFFVYKGGKVDYNTVWNI